MSTALVTGCSTGMGFATALRLAREGFDVFAAMRSPERDGARLVDAAAEAGVSVGLVRLDVDDDESVSAAFSESGPVDVLVNNAGVMHYASVEETPIAQWRRLMETNLFGAVRCMRAVLPGMQARGSGCIVNISSPAGRVSLPAMAAYSASKAALEAASEVLAMEGRPHGIRVVVIEPGLIKTAMGDKLEPPSRDSQYWPTTRNTLSFLAAASVQPSEPEVIADAVARAVGDPATPFRVAAGRWAAELVELRRRHSDEAWTDFVSSPTRGFAEQYHEKTGIDLFGPP